MYMHPLLKPSMRYEDASTESIIKLDKNEFNPYVNNAGTCLAIAGKDFVLVGGDTRTSDGGYGIISRYQSKVRMLGTKACMATSGMYADAQFLHKNLKMNIEQYQYKTDKEPGIQQIGRLVSVTLYRRRNMPWYTFNLVAGLNEEGRGVIYAYDAIGSSGTYQYAACGSGEPEAITILDRYIMPLMTEQKIDQLTIDQAKNLAEETMKAVAERDIYTGDCFQYFVITKDGFQEFKLELRRD